MEAWPSREGRAAVSSYRLRCSTFYVDVRLFEANGRWIAAADLPDGPSLGCGVGPMQALWQALERFDGVRDELLASQGW